MQEEQTINRADMTGLRQILHQPVIFPPHQAVSMIIEIHKNIIIFLKPRNGRNQRPQYKNLPFLFQLLYQFRLLIILDIPQDCCPDQLRIRPVCPPV